jgi:hypothetical protein
MNIEFTIESLANMDVFSVSQKLMDSPIPKAIEYLGAGGDWDED